MGTQRPHAGWLPMVGLGLVVGTSCAAATEAPPSLVVLVDTDLPVPQGLDGLRIEAESQGVPFHRKSYALGEGDKTLPATFPITPGERGKGKPIRLRALGFLGGQAVVMRQAILSLPDTPNYVGFVRLPLNLFCQGSRSLGTEQGDPGPCGENGTCDGGQCTNAQTTVVPWQPESWAEFTQPRGQSLCFDTQTCFQNATEAEPTRDAGGRCIVPGPFETATQVALRPIGGFTGPKAGTLGAMTVLSRSNEGDGFRVEDSTLHLPSGACDLNLMALVAKEGTCPPKGPTQPLCPLGAATPTASPPAPEVKSPPTSTDDGGASPARDAGPTPKAGDSGPSDAAPDAFPPPVPVTVSGTIDGLDQDGLTLLLNRDQRLTIPKGSTSFAFPTGLWPSTDFAIEVQSQPPDRACTVSPVQSTIPLNGALGGIAITCVPYEDPKVRQVVAGLTHTCALLTTGHVRCWGSAESGRTGGSTTTSAVQGIENGTRLAAGEAFTCALLENKTVSCWGNFWPSPDTSLDRSKPETILVSEQNGVTDITAGRSHACALMVDTTVHCWAADAPVPDLASWPPEAIPGLSGVDQISAGDMHTCALLKDSTVRCWGQNDKGQVGPSSPTESIPGLSGVRQVSAGLGFTCVLMDTGRVRCWGQPLRNEPPRTFPMQEDLQGLSGVRLVQSAGSRVCVVTDTGRVRCWGEGVEESLAKSSMTQDSPWMDGVKTLSVGPLAPHSCAVLRDDSLRCWGKNESEQLGILPAKLGPTVILGANRIAMGASHVCVAAQEGTVQCWGSNDNNQLGNPKPGDPLPGLSGVKQMSSFDRHTCAVLEDTTVRCWGFNVNQQLAGSGGTTQSIPGLSGVLSVAVGGLHSCAVLETGTVRCWGEVGNPEAGITDGTSILTDVPDLSGVDKMASGRSHVCVGLEDSSVFCWGIASNGRLGFSTSQKVARGTVPGLSGVRALAAGTSHTCALMNDETVRCWGDNSMGQTAGSSVVSPVAGVTNVIELTAGHFHTCARLRNASVRCWGRLPTDQNRGSSPGVSVPFVPGALAIGGGLNANCAILPGDKVLCWGDTRPLQLTDDPPREPPYDPFFHR